MRRGRRLHDAGGCRLVARLNFRRSESGVARHAGGGTVRGKIRAPSVARNPYGHRLGFSGALTTEATADALSVAGPATAARLEPPGIPNLAAGEAPPVAG